jgi:RNA recognition motif-containing protein
LSDITNKANNDESEKSLKAQARPQRERRERGPPADGIPSKTKVMVANLPYDLTEEKLIELFKSYEPSSAKIALRPIPRFMIKKLQARGEARKGRGFGFVTLSSEEQQQKAVAEMNGKEIEGREIAVKVAIDSPDKTDEEANHHHEGETTNGQQETPAAPAAAVAPAAPAAEVAAAPTADATTPAPTAA